MILSCNNISKSFGTDIIIKSCSFNIEDHEKAAIVGINGAGKSTLLKIITGEEPADTGIVTLAKDKTLGYLAQQQELQSDRSIYDELLSVKQYILDMESELRRIEDAMNSASGDELDALMNRYTNLNHEFEMNNGYAYKSEITGVLKGLGFAEEDFSLHVNTLSGGQKTRVSLGKLLLSKPDIIMLDEPTNHLDIASKEILEEALNSYTGTVLYVSHDRYFINQTATRILDLTNQSVVNYIGDYDYYLEKKEELTEKYAPTAQEATEEAKEETPSEGKLTWQQQKEEQARKRKQENELKKVEKRIEELETRDKEIDDTLVLPDVCTNVGRCAELSREKDKIQAELEELYEKWEELA